ncbi:hypothetical protein BJ742DRAFT_829431 [Cladochytrium replicatum]|nr:hypothetical protein BJ742DRAFT_829431 [Cladochytrium replicatum]
MSTRHERLSDKAQTERHTKVLKALMQREDNRRCADCRKKDPRWASWNLGIFICIRCSGIHRSMGTHISKVKSADLDAWTPEQIESMLKWGNGKANWYWENELPSGIEPPESAIDQWIRAKYERKQYAKKGAIPDPETIPLPAGVNPIEVCVFMIHRFSLSNILLCMQINFTDSKKVPTAAKVASVPTSPPKATPPPASSATADLLFGDAPASKLSPAKSASDDLFAAFQTAPVSATSGQTAAPIAGSASPAPNSADSLKMSILSLYKQAPAAGISPGSPALSISGIPGRTGTPTQATATPPMDPSVGFSAFTSNTTTVAPAAPASQAKIGNGLDDLFGGLMIAPSSTTPQPPRSNVAASLSGGELFGIGGAGSSGIGSGFPASFGTAAITPSANGGNYGTTASTVAPPAFDALGTWGSATANSSSPKVGNISTTVAAGGLDGDEWGAFQ